MPEYFDISLIIRKTYPLKGSIKKCLAQLGLSLGENKIKYFGEKKVTISHFIDEEADFDEIYIGIPEQNFHKDLFGQELEMITSFINNCFERNNEIQYALCSYELNGYLIGDIKSVNNFSEEFLSKFPIIYSRNKERKYPSLILNLQAQEMFH